MANENNLEAIIQSLQDLSIEEKQSVSSLCNKWKIRTPTVMLNIIKKSTIVDLIGMGFVPGVIEQLAKLLDVPQESKFLTGLPPLSIYRSGGPTNPSSVSESHGEAILKTKKFKLLPIPNRTAPSRLWFNYNADGLVNFKWNSEEDIRQLVLTTLKDAIHTAGLLNKVELRNELGIFRVRSDMWVVLVHGFPIGAVEVKKPEEGVLSDKLVWGQMYDYLLRLSTFYGLKHVFGILTTYAEWRICWLKSSDTAAQSEITTDPSETNLQDIQEIPDWKDDYVDADEDRDIEDAEDDREFYGTAILPCTNSELPKFLVSVLLKMYASPHSQVQLVDETRPYIKLNEKIWTWVKFNKPLKLHKVPNSTTKNYILLRDFRGGAHGRVWLASSTSGRVCVIKFSQSHSEESLQNEAKIWTTVWRVPVYVKMIGGHPALVMPYVSPCSAEKGNEPNVKQAILDALTALADNNYIHDDLRWRHVGLFKHNGQLRAILFDLAVMTSNVSRTKALKQMKEALGYN